MQHVKDPNHPPHQMKKMAGISLKIIEVKNACKPLAWAEQGFAQINVASHVSQVCIAQPLQSILEGCQVRVRTTRFFFYNSRM